MAEQPSEQHQQRWSPHTLVADTGHLDLVEAVLDDLALNHQRVPPSPAPDVSKPIEPTDGTGPPAAPDRLGLARLDLTDGDFRPLEDIDGVLEEVRRRIAARHGGWLPALGKDRQAISTVISGGNPKPTAAVFQPQPVGISGGNPKPTAGAEQPEPVPDAGLPSTATASTSGRTVRIGLVDTPASDLAVPGEVWTAHSTFVRSIVSEAAPTAEIRARSVLSGERGTGALWDVAAAMLDLVHEDGVEILLLPLACFTADGRPPLLLDRALQRIGDRALIIAAAGNQTLQAGWTWLGRGRSSPAWPGAHDRVRAVGTVFTLDDESQAADQEPTQPWVDALTTRSVFVGPFFTGPVDLGDGTVQDFTGAARWRGTSFCAAHAAGLVAARMDDGTTAEQAWGALLDEGTELRRPPVLGMP